ncbi:MAG: cytochrome b/b6 domain-containing protein [Pseudomonadota bacterium]|nr:cytochrome b/b6 domain-containing protein [Pseudomonadota bacterium]
MQADRIKVWDPLVRVFHWTVVVCVAAAWLSADDFRSIHEWLGYTVAALVVLRVVWGCVGSRHARFSQFVRGAASVATYGRSVVKGTAPRYLGHNPLGGWMVLALMATLLSLGLTGWMMTLDTFFGDEWLETLHELLADGLLLLIVVHVSGVLVTGWMHGENLVRAMLTGEKRRPDVGDVD